MCQQKLAVKKQECSFPSLNPLVIQNISHDFWLSLEGSSITAITTQKPLLVSQLLRWFLAFSSFHHNLVSNISSS
jgi:hypothetical protein